MRAFLFLLKYSYRNLWRSKSRSLILIFSLSFGTGFIIWDLNFATSGSREVMKEFLSQYAGFYQVTHPDYYSKTAKNVFSIYKTISDDDFKDQTLFPLSTKRVTSLAFISGEKKTLGVLLTGIDTEKEERLNKLKSSITEGRYLVRGERKEILLGKKLAMRIEAKVGSTVAVVGSSVDGSVANELMEVVGILDFGGGDLEEGLAFTQIETAQSFLAMAPERYHQRVSFDAINDEPPVLTNLSATSWKKLLPEIAVSVRFIDNFTWIVSIIMVMVLSLGLSNTFTITFFEREKEFKSLNILGASSRFITMSLFLEVFLLGTISVVIGIVFGFIATTICSFYPINIELFTGGKPILMGGMVIRPLVKFYPESQYYWQVPLMIYFFLLLSLVYPLIRLIQRRKNVA